MIAEDEVVHIRGMAISPEDRIVKKKYGSEEFTLGIMMPDDRDAIARIVALDYYQGLPVSSFEAATRDRFERDATLTVCVKDGPETWRGPGDCLDEDLKNRLYADILNINKTFQEKLKKNKFAKGGAETRVPSKRVPAARGQRTST